MRNRFPVASTLFALACAGLPLQSAWAVSYCVGTIGDIKAKLAEASTNGFSDEVKIKTGFYQPTAAQCDAAACFEVHVTDGEMLRISGGWDATCQQQSKFPQDTIFDGSNARRLFSVEWQHANVDNNDRSTFRNIELRNGVGTAFGYGGCASFVNNSGDLAIDQSLFTGCAVYGGYGGGFSASARQLFVRNNLVVNNEARFGAGAYLDVTRSTLLAAKSSYVHNNTIANNLSSLGTDGTGGLQLLGATSSVSQVYFSNNIVHGNDAGTNRVDIDVDVARMYSANNLYRTLAGTPGPGSTNTANLNANPRFVGANNYALAAESPARERGQDTPQGGMLTWDLSGGVRLSGAHIDIGAYEAHDDVIFAADFQD
jgi:hypothetical protein